MTDPHLNRKTTLGDDYKSEKYPLVLPDIPRIPKGLSKMHSDERKVMEI